MTAVARLRGVTRIYHSRAEDVVALDDVTVELASGSVVAIVGPSGSGKSTLINLLVGWDRPTEGEVVLADSSTSDWHGTAIVPQDLGLLEELTLLENIELPVRLGNRQHLDLDELVAELGLTDVAGQLPAGASLGEQQRAAVGRALVTGPRLLVADEPTSHQDEANTLRVAAMLRRAANDGGAVLVATHDPRVVEHADDVIYLRDGRIVQPDGP